jgi:hypothetical protein
MCSRPPDSWGSVAAAAKVAAKERARVMMDLTMVAKEGMRCAIIPIEEDIRPCLHDC